MIDLSDIHLFCWGELWYEKYEIEMALDAMKILIDKQENSWKEIRKNFEKIAKNDSMLNSLNEEGQGSYYSQFFEMEERTIYEIKRLQRGSAFMTIFAFFEGRLKNICQKIESNNKLHKKLNEVKGESDIQKLWKYLSDVYKIDTTKVEYYYNLIEDQKFARNRIVHHEGYLSKDQKKTTQFS